MQGSEKWKWSRSVVSDSSNPMDCSLPGSSIHGIFQARVLEWGAIAFYTNYIADCSLKAYELIYINSLGIISGYMQIFYEYCFYCHYHYLKDTDIQIIFFYKSKIYPHAAYKGITYNKMLKECLF